MTGNRWAELRQVGLATLDHEAAVRAAQASRTAKVDNIAAVDLHATDREHGVGRHGELCNTLIRFV